MNQQMKAIRHPEKLLEIYKDMALACKLTHNEFEKIITKLEEYIKETKK
jgi:hypothetical protein